MGLSNGPGFTPQKTQFFEEKMLRLFKIFFLKNSSPFFLKPWRVGASNINILLIGAIKNYNFFYCHFLLRPFLSKIFAGPFHQAKAESSSRHVDVPNKSSISVAILRFRKKELRITEGCTFKQALPDYVQTWYWRRGEFWYIRNWQ